MINVFASNKGWLFNDLLLRFDQAGCTSTFQPLPEADAYIVLRSSEAHLCPDLSRAVVQIHCMEPRLIGKPEVLNRAEAFCFTHTHQVARLTSMGVHTATKPQMLRPIGSAQLFTLRESIPDVFTVGWVGRNTGRKGMPLFIEAIHRASKCLPLRVLLVGALLEEAASALDDLGVAGELHQRNSHQAFAALDYRALYHEMDVLCITSETEAGPLPLFEALACGVPVVSTAVGWAPFLLDSTVEPNAAALQNALVAVGQERGAWFDRRAELRGSQPWRLEDWIQECIELAERIAR